MRLPGGRISDNCDLESPGEAGRYSPGDNFACFGFEARAIIVVVEYCGARWFVWQSQHP